MPLTEIKTRLGIPSSDTSKDDQLTQCLADATDQFKGYCKRIDVPTDAVTLVDRIAILIYNRTASGYRQSETLGDYSAVNFVMNDDLPKSLRGQLNSFRKLKLI